MVIIREKTAPKQESEMEQTTLDEIISLNYVGFVIERAKLESCFIFGDGGSLARGQVNGISSDDLGLRYKSKTIVAFPITEIKDMAMRKKDVVIWLKDGTTVGLYFKRPF